MVTPDVSLNASDPGHLSGTAHMAASAAANRLCDVDRLRVCMAACEYNNSHIVSLKALTSPPKHVLQQHALAGAACLADLARHASAAAS